MYPISLLTVLKTKPWQFLNRINQFLFALKESMSNNLTICNVFSFISGPLIAMFSKRICLAYFSNTVSISGWSDPQIFFRETMTSLDLKASIIALRFNHIEFMVECLRPSSFTTSIRLHSIKIFWMSFTLSVKVNEAFFSWRCSLYWNIESTELIRSKKTNDEKSCNYTNYNWIEQPEFSEIEKGMCTAVSLMIVTDNEILCYVTTIEVDTGANCWPQRLLCHCHSILSPTM